MKAIDQVLEKVFEGERIGPEEGLTLLRSRELQKVGQAADFVRRRYHPEGVVSFLIDRNINYTNVCVARCTFCNFYRRPGDERSFSNRWKARSGQRCGVGDAISRRCSRL